MIVLDILYYEHSTIREKGIINKKKYNKISLKDDHDLYQQPKLGTLSTWLNMALPVESIITHLLQLQTYNVNKMKFKVKF